MLDDLPPMAYGLIQESGIILTRLWLSQHLQASFEHAYFSLFTNMHLQAFTINKKGCQHNITRKRTHSSCAPFTKLGKCWRTPKG